jgi:hypothetical protein
MTLFYLESDSPCNRTNRPLFCAKGSLLHRSSTATMKRLHSYGRTPAIKYATTIIQSGGQKIVPKDGLPTARSTNNNLEGPL